MNKQTTPFRCSWLHMAVLLLVSMIATVHSPAQSLGVKVAGHDVTSTNASDILKKIGIGSGKMSYDANTHTLTLENVSLKVEEYVNAIESSSELSTFTIELRGNNKIEHYGGRIDLGAHSNTITGTGALKCISTVNAAIFIDESQLTIQGGCKLDLSGTWGICGDQGLNERLTINASTVKAQGYDGSICDLGSIKLTDCTVTSPLGASTEGGAVTVNGAKYTGQVVIEQVNTDFDLSVKGIKVTKENALDILGNQSVTYDIQHKTLQLNNATIESDEVPAIMANSDINILVNGKNTLTATKANAVQLNGSCKISGNGTILATSTNEAGITIHGDLAIDELANLQAKGKYGIIGTGGEDAKNTLNIKNSTLKAHGTSGSILGFNDITFEGCHIFTPEGTCVKKGGVYIGDDICKDEISIDKTEFYFYLGEKQASSENYRDILGDGTASYDREKHVLTLKNFNYETSMATSGLNVPGAVENITIILKGENKISTPYFGVALSSDATIKGDGSLMVESQSSAIIISKSTLTIEEGPSLEISSSENGFTSLNGFPGDLLLRSAKVKVQGKTGSIRNLKSITLDNCHIISPANTEIEDGTIMLDGKACTKQIVIEPKSSGVSETMVSTLKCWSDSYGLLHLSSVTDEQTSIYDASGRLLHSTIVCGEIAIPLPQGIYIVKSSTASQKVVVASK